VGLIGSALRDLRAWGYRIADDRYQGNLDMVMAIFTPQGAQQVDFDTRLQAADALGQAGDPRIDSERPDYWVRFDKSAQPQEEMRAFEMGRYPVTVFNFQKFIHAGGYQDEGLWSAGSGRDYHEPDNWQQQLRYPNRPVVGVSWFEAAAYCAWAGGRLPNELEWEYAGHAGTGSRYPWGNEPPSTLRANYSGAGPGRLTPVGLYPAGATHSGVHDLAGNCFEWTADPWRERRGASSDDGQRVVRGGAWDFDERFLAVACRFGHRTDVRLRNLGFRCVRDAK
jgi:formylglycine-generating enzyme required for sulfatase activity